MSVFNKTDPTVLSNIAPSTTANFALRGGNYWIETKSTGTGTIDVYRR